MRAVALGFAVAGGLSAMRGRNTAQALAMPRSYRSARLVGEPSAMVKALNARHRGSLMEQLLTWVRALQLVVQFLPLFFLYEGCMRSETLRPHYIALLAFALRRSGACTIKLAQWLSTRHDVIPPDLAETLGEMRSLAPAHGYEATQAALGECIREALQRALSHNHMDAVRLLLGHPTSGQPSVSSESEQEALYEEAALLLAQGRRKAGEELLRRTFEWVEAEPLASGAIAQVHRGMLAHAPEGWDRLVALKVRHPGVEKAISRDLKALGLLAAAVEGFWGLSWMRLSDNVENFRDRMLVQCSLEEEAEHLLRFEHNFATVPAIVFPRPHPYLVHEAVLVESFERGVPIDFVTRENVSRELASAVAQSSLDCYLKMALVDNFVHADLHAGNLLVRNFRFLEGRTPRDLNGIHQYEPTSSKMRSELASSSPPDFLENVRQSWHRWSQKVRDSWLEFRRQIGWPSRRMLAPLDKSRVTTPQIVILDCGLVTTLNETDRKTLLRAFEAVAGGDASKSSEVLMQSESDSPRDLEGLQREMADLVARSRNHDTAQFGMSKMLIELLDIGRRHKITIASNFTTISVATSVMEGIARRLDPSLNLFERSSALFATTPELRNRLLVSRLESLSSLIN